MGQICKLCKFVVKYILVYGKEPLFINTFIANWQKGRGYMIIFKDMDKDVRVKKVVPYDVEAEDITVIFSKYVEPSLAGGLAAIYKSVIGNQEFLILKDNGKIYELSFNEDKPEIKVSEKFEKMMTVLTTAGLNVSKSLNCIFDVFFADEVEYSGGKKKLCNERPAWIPSGYKYLTGDMYTGYVIVDDCGNEFTYVPYMDIYVSRYEISLNKNHTIASLPEKDAWVNVKYKEAYKAAKNFDPKNKSDLLDSVKQIVEAISKKTGKEYPGTVYCGNVELKTGSMPENMLYNIDCLVGNHYCILKFDKDVSSYTHAYGASYKGERKYPHLNGEEKTFSSPSPEIGFRICLKR